MDSSSSSFENTASVLHQLSLALESESPDGAFARWHSLGRPVQPVSWKSLLSGMETAGGGSTGMDSSLHEMLRTLENAKQCCIAPDAPILAVMGLLNAGKSSLVASFLSEPGRARILIGSGNHEGTHRFVLWLPAAWKANDSVWSFLRSRLQATFPIGLEFLSDDKDLAARQYNNTETVDRSLLASRSSSIECFEPSGDAPSSERVSMMDLPLIAFDTGLDRLQIALMDCPDVQTGMLVNDPLREEGRSDSLVHYMDSIASRRLRTLSRAAPICSAFLIVLPANAMHDQKVSELIDAVRAKMPQSLEFLAVNRVPRRYATKEIRDEVKHLYGGRLIDRVYMAYGFDGPLMRERLPTPPKSIPLPHFADSSEAQSTLPLFFRIDGEQVSQPPAPIPHQDWLLTIGDSLDSKGLMKQALQSQLTVASKHIVHSIDWIQEVVQKWSRQREAMRLLIARACLEFSLDPSNRSKIRLQASRQIVEQLSRSLERTAPWWAMPGRWTARIAEYGKNQVGQLGQWLQFPSWISGKSEGLLRFIRGRWSSNEGASIVTADAMMKVLQRVDSEGIWQLDSGGTLGRNDGSTLGQDRGGMEAGEDLHHLVQTGIDRFQAESRIELDSSELDKVTSRMWEQMPFGKRLLTGLAPAAVLFAPLVAVIMLPLDFGGSSVLVFASIKELLGAGVAGLGIAILSPDKMPKLAESEAAWNQLGDLVAVLCDTLQLERPSIHSPITLELHGESRRLPTSSIPVHYSGLDKAPSQWNSSVQALVPPQVEVRAESVQAIKNLIRSLTF